MNVVPLGMCISTVYDEVYKVTVRIVIAIVIT